jgi:hypothetical protein
MRRKLGLLGAAAVALVAVAVPVALAWRVLPPSSQDEIVASAGAVTPVQMQQRPPGVSRMVVSTPSFPRIAHGRVQVQVGTYVRAPSETIQLVYRDGRGKTITSCRIPPSEYADNGNIDCPIPRTDRVRQIAISARGRAPLAVFVANDGTTRVAGTLVQVRRLGTLGARLRDLEARVGVTRPVLFSPVVLLTALVASVALFGAAVLVLLQSELATRNRMTERPPLGT